MNQTQPSTATNAFLAELFSLAGRSAVVIGGTSGLGAESAVALAAAGASVTVAGRDAARAASVVERIEAQGGSAFADHVDVVDERSVSALAERTAERHGGVDVLVNSAGIVVPAAGLEITVEDWRRHMETNVTGTFLACRELGRRMLERGSGSIVNFASDAAFRGVPEMAAYCASKGAVVQLTRTLGAEWIGSGVRVNAIGPSDFDTPMAAPFADDEEFVAWQKTVVPIGRFGTPGEIVGAVLFLASDASSMVAGTTVMVDGGRTAV